MRAAVGLLAVLICAGASPEGRAGREITVADPAHDRATLRLGPRDSGRRIEIRAGARFTVALRANPSTGYGWEVVETGAPVVRQVGDPTFVEDNREAGAGGTITFAFRAERPGTASLKLAYARPWEKDKEPADTFAITVAVTE